MSMYVLAIDIGNSSAAIGLFNRDILIGTTILPSNTNCNSQSFMDRISRLTEKHNIEISNLEVSILSSVHPHLSDDICLPLKERGIPLILFDRTVFSHLPLDIPKEDEIGSDIVANALAAHHYYPGDRIIIDFGTATTITGLKASGQILGVNISLGIKASLQSLNHRIPLLPKAPLHIPNQSLGYDTISAIQNGVIKGNIGLIRHLIDVIRTEYNSEFKLIYTGGLSAFIAPYIEYPGILDRHLALKGLNQYVHFIHP